jgi:hypothetical protein
MNSKGQFENLEIMSRERATLARKEAEHWLAEAEYWLAEAEEWRQLKESPASSRREMRTARDVSGRDTGGARHEDRIMKIPR